MSFQKPKPFNQNWATIEEKQRTNTNINTNNSLAFSQTLQEKDEIELDRIPYFQSKQSIQTQKQYEYVPYSQRQLYIKQKNDPCSIVLNSLTQKDVDNFVKSLKMVKFLTKQTIDKKIFIENKKEGVKKLRNKIKATEDRIIMQKQQFLRKAKIYRQRSESVKKAKVSKFKRFKTEIVDMKKEISLIKKKLSENKDFSKRRQTGNEKRRSSLRFHTEAVQQRIYVPLPYPINQNQYHYTRPQTYQQIYQLRSPNPQTIPIFKRTSYNNEQTSARTSNRSSQVFTNENKDKFHSSKNLFDIIAQKIKISGGQNHLIVPYSKTEEINYKKQQNKSVRIKRSDVKKMRSKKSSIFDESTVKIICEQTNSYSLSQQLSSQIQIKQKSQMQKSSAVSIYFPSHFVKDFKISNLEESVQSKYTSTQRIKQLPLPNKKQKQKKSVRFHDSISQDYSDMNMDEIALTSKSKFSKQSKYLPSSLQNSQSLGQGSGFGQLHLTSQSNLSPPVKKRRQANEDNIKIIQ